MTPAGKGSTLPRLSVTPREASQMLGLKLPRMWRLLRDGEIPSRRAGRLLLIRVRDLEAWLDASEKKEHRS